MCRGAVRLGFCVWRKVSLHFGFVGAAASFLLADDRLLCAGVRSMWKMRVLATYRPSMTDFCVPGAKLVVVTHYFLVHTAPNFLVDDRRLFGDGELFVDEGVFHFLSARGVPSHAGQPASCIYPLLCREMAPLWRMMCTCKRNMRDGWRSSEHRVGIWHAVKMLNFVACNTTTGSTGGTALLMATRNSSS